MGALVVALAAVILAYSYRRQLTRLRWQRNALREAVQGLETRVGDTGHVIEGVRLALWGGNSSFTGAAGGVTITKGVAYGNEDQAQSAVMDSITRLLQELEWTLLFHIP